MQSSIFLLNGAMRITLVNVIYKSNLVIPRYLQYINQDLIPGEKVTQAQHAQQAAELARAAGHPPHVLVGALLHDIGHLSGGVLGGFYLGGHPYYWCISFMQNYFGDIKGHLVGLERGLPAMTEGGQVRMAGTWCDNYTGHDT